jgi:hypothetical protein
VFHTSEDEERVQSLVSWSRTAVVGIVVEAFTFSEDFSRLKRKNLQAQEIF